LLIRFHELENNKNTFLASQSLKDDLKKYDGLFFEPLIQYVLQLNEKFYMADRIY